MTLLTSALVGLIFGWVNAFIASKKGRDPLLWFVLGLFFALISLIILLVLPAVKPKKRVEGDSPFVGTTIDVTPLGAKEGVTTTEIRLDSVEDQSWFYLDERRQQKGPITFLQLKELFKERIVVDNTYLWSEGMSEWMPLSRLDIVNDRLRK